ncbi:uncharacterized protein LOC119445498 [Dermacentor silvarum]|uniref:uncharacterized protein LOC119445498 n=1 Tax=Dermacentor silvarum TaxID=543639 RepID=UPI001896A6CC|nr:uncharacterized protein LOC119445498 [Dermacentor silvarum]
MSKMASLKHGRMKYITIITSCGLLQLLLMFLQPHRATGAVVVVPQSMPYVLQPSMGMRSTAVGTAEMPMGVGSMGVGSMGIGSMGMNTMGQQLGGVMIPTGGNVAQNPPPVVLTDGSGQNKVVGSADPLTGVIAVDANKLKEGLGAATAEDPPAPPPAE